MNSQPDPLPEPARSKWVFAFGVYLILLNLVLLYVLLRLWPGQVPLKADHLPVTLIPGVWGPEVWTEARFLALVAVAGAPGGQLYLTRPFSHHFRYPHI